MHQPWRHQTIHLTHWCKKDVQKITFLEWLGIFAIHTTKQTTFGKGLQKLPSHILYTFIKSSKKFLVIKIPWNALRKMTKMQTALCASDETNTWCYILIYLPTHFEPFVMNLAFWLCSRNKAKKYNLHKVALSRFKSCVVKFSKSPRSLQCTVVQ